MSTQAALEELRHGMDRLRGRLFSTIEAMGLPEKQENAAKGLIRQTSYDCQSNLEAAIRQNGAKRADDN
jgi:hypothetical protein